MLWYFWKEVAGQPDCVEGAFLRVFAYLVFVEGLVPGVYKE